MFNEINITPLNSYIKIENGQRSLVLRSPDDSIECKSRFAYINADKHCRAMVFGILYD